MVSKAVKRATLLLAVIVHNLLCIIVVSLILISAPFCRHLTPPNKYTIFCSTAFPKFFQFLSTLAVDKYGDHLTFSITNSRLFGIFQICVFCFRRNAITAFLTLSFSR